MTHPTLEGPLDPARQTRLAAFLMSAHGAGARLLAGAALAPQLDDGWKVEMHSQFCREMEILSLLSRATRWTLDPMLPLLAWQWEVAWLPRPVAVDDAAEALAIDAAAFGHALHGAIRPATLVPPDTEPTDSFVQALMRIELESGRLLQANALLLKAERLAPMRPAVTAAVESRHAGLSALWHGMVNGLR